jgi:hypothetical protein
VSSALDPVRLKPSPGKRRQILQLGGKCYNVGTCFDLMACKHGNRTYVQLLLDPLKADLLKNEQEKAGYKKLSDYLRSVLYQYIEETKPELYPADTTTKGLSWSEKVARRVDGKKAKRKERLEAWGDLIIKNETNAV